MSKTFYYKKRKYYCYKDQDNGLWGVNVMSKDSTRINWSSSYTLTIPCKFKTPTGAFISAKKYIKN